MTPNPHALLSQRAAAREYRISEEEIAAAREAGRIPYRRRGRAIQMRRCDLERYIASTLTGDPLPTAPTLPVEDDDPDFMRRMIREIVPDYKPQRRPS